MQFSLSVVEPIETTPTKKHGFFCIFEAFASNCGAVRIVLPLVPSGTQSVKVVPNNGKVELMIGTAAGFTHCRWQMPKTYLVFFIHYF